MLKPFQGHTMTVPGVPWSQLQSELASFDCKIDTGTAEEAFIFFGKSLVPFDQAYSTSEDLFHQEPASLAK